MTLDNVVAAAKTNKDKIFFTPTGQIVVAGIGTDTDGKPKVIQYGVDNTEYNKVTDKLKDFINGTVADKTVKDYVDTTTNALTIQYVSATPDTPAHIALFANGGKNEH